MREKFFTIPFDLTIERWWVAWVSLIWTAVLVLAFAAPVRSAERANALSGAMGFASGWTSFSWEANEALTSTEPDAWVNFFEYRHRGDVDQMKRLGATWTIIWIDWGLLAPQPPAAPDGTVTLQDTGICPSNGRYMVENLKDAAILLKENGIEPVMVMWNYVPEWHRVRASDCREDDTDWNDDNCFPINSDESTGYSFPHPRRLDEWNAALKFFATYFQSYQDGDRTYPLANQWLITEEQTSGAWNINLNFGPYVGRTWNEDGSGPMLRAPEYYAQVLYRSYQTLGSIPLNGMLPFKTIVGGLFTGNPPFRMERYQWFVHQLAVELGRLPRKVADALTLHMPRQPYSFGGSFGEPATRRDFSMMHEDINERWPVSGPDARTRGALFQEEVEYAANEFNAIRIGDDYPYAGIDIWIDNFFPGSPGHDANPEDTVVAWDPAELDDPFWGNVRRYEQALDLAQVVRFANGWQSDGGSRVVRVSIEDHRDPTFMPPSFNTPGRAIWHQGVLGWLSESIPQWGPYSSPDGIDYHYTNWETKPSYQVYRDVTAGRAVDDIMADVGDFSESYPPRNTIYPDWSTPWGPLVRRFTPQRGSSVTPVRITLDGQQPAALTEVRFNDVLGTDLRDEGVDTNVPEAHSWTVYPPNLPSGTQAKIAIRDAKGVVTEFGSFTYEQSASAAASNLLNPATSLVVPLILNCGTQSDSLRLPTRHILSGSRTR